jgi:hypothetical protein
LTKKGNGRGGEHQEAYLCGNQRHREAPVDTDGDIPWALCHSRYRLWTVDCQPHWFKMAANAGASAVGVTYGGGDPAHLEQAHPHAVVPSVAELARVLGVEPELNAELARRGKARVSA